MISDNGQHGESGLEHGVDGNALEAWIDGDMPAVVCDARGIAEGDG